MVEYIVGDQSNLPKLARRNLELKLGELRESLEEEDKQITKVDYTGLDTVFVECPQTMGGTGSFVISTTDGRTVKPVYEAGAWITVEKKIHGV